MRKRLLLSSLLVLAAAGCDQTPVQATADGTQPAADELTPPGADELTPSADSTGRGGNVMGSGH